MGFLDSKKGKDVDIEDTIKILATNLEVINQKLANTSPDSDSTRETAEIRGDLHTLAKRLEEMGNFLKTSQDTITQQLSYTMNIFQGIQKSVKTTEKNLTDVQIENREALKEYIEKKNNTVISYISNATNSTLDVLKKQQNDTARIVANDKEVRKELNTHFSDVIKQVSAIPGSFDEIDKRLNSMKASIATMPAHIPIQQPTKGKKGEQIDIKDIQIKIPEELSKDLAGIKELIGSKYSEISRMVFTLLKINKDLIDILKDSDDGERKRYHEELDNMFSE